MKIFIHTSGRPDKQITWDNLPPSVRENTWLLVQAREAAAYSKYPQVEVLPDGIRKLSPTRQWIIDNTLGEKVIMMDDDLTFSCRHADTGTKLHKATHTDITRMFLWMEHTLTYKAHVGISAREGNNRVEEGEKDVGRMMRILGYNLQTLSEITPVPRFDRIDTKQDFDMTLQLLRAGYENTIAYNWAHNQPGSNNVGGCSAYRTPEVMDRCANELAQLHPDFVKVVEKETKTSWGGGKRTDVRISWAKAFASSGRDDK